jgi:predicted nucleic acid-binding protein
MIVYVDSSAFAKRYLAEAGSRDVEALVRQADAVGTALITRPEISAAIAKLVRLGSLDRQHGEAALRAFRRQWPELTAIQLTEAITAEADTLAWEQDLRGYDAVHLASALSWQRALERAVTLATYDKDLWRGAQRVGLVAWPERLG